MTERTVGQQGEPEQEGPVDRLHAEPLPRGFPGGLAHRPLILTAESGDIADNARFPRDWNPEPAELGICFCPAGTRRPPQPHCSPAENVSTPPLAVCDV